MKCPKCKSKLIRLEFEASSMETNDCKYLELRYACEKCGVYYIKQFRQQELKRI